MSIPDTHNRILSLCKPVLIKKNLLRNVSKLETNTWCQCTTGYSKVIFEKAFGCEVYVELLKSVKMGDDICLMKIITLETIQF